MFFYAATVVNACASQCCIYTYNVRLVERYTGWYIKRSHKNLKVSNSVPCVFDLRRVHVPGDGRNGALLMELQAT